MMGGFALEGAASVEHGTPAAKVLHTYADLSMVKTFTGGYIESLSFIVLVPALVLVAHVFSRRTDLGRLASRTFLGLGVAYVASTLAVGFPPGAAALYAAQHGVDAGTIATVNDIRNYSFVLQVALSMADDRGHRRGRTRRAAPRPLDRLGRPGLRGRRPGVDPGRAQRRSRRSGWCGGSGSAWCCCARRVRRTDAQDAAAGAP